MQDRKHYFLYLPLSIDKDKSERFVVEADSFPNPKAETFAGKVVARGNKAWHYIGDHSYGWCNPIREMSEGCQPSFIIIHPDRVKEMFKGNHTLP